MSSSYYSFFVDPARYSTTGNGDGYAVISLGKTGLLSLYCTNLTNATRWVQIFDGTAQPAGGTNPIAEVQVAANSQNALWLPEVHWMPLVNGLVVASSTTAATYTAGGATDLFLTIFYIYR